MSDQRQRPHPRRIVTLFSWRWFAVLAFFLGAAIAFVYEAGLDESNWRFVIFAASGVFASYTCDEWEKQLREREEHDGPRA